jgi:hypothetical protein
MREQTKIKQARGNKAERRYLEFMNELYTLKQFSRRDMEEKYSISRSLCTSLYRKDYLVIVGKNYNGSSIWKWIGPEPTIELAHNIIEEHRKQMKERRRMKRIEKQSTQLSIKPIRKAPVFTHKPIVHEAECDTSNSKMLLILAVGAMVGFMIATIIWK